MAISAVKSPEKFPPWCGEMLAAMRLASANTDSDGSWQTSLTQDRERSELDSKRITFRTYMRSVMVANPSWLDFWLIRCTITTTMAISIVGGRYYNLYTLRAVGHPRLTESILPDQ